METDAPCYAWRMTSGAEPGAVKAASPVLNGEDEETDRKVLRLVLTQLECAFRVFMASSCWEKMRLRAC